MRHLFHHYHRGGAPVLPVPEKRGGRRVPLVYVRPGYPACGDTVEAFRAAGADVEIVDVSADEQARRDLKLCGYQQFPVVNTGSAIWSGHQPARIRAFAENAFDEERSVS